jgi:CrcB protein
VKIQVLFAVMFAGGLGASVRYMLDTAITHHNKTGLPLPTLIINMTGSFALGVLVALVSGDGFVGNNAVLTSVIGSGFLGGYTTFSTASVETARLLLGRRRIGVVLLVAMPLSCLASAAIGLGIGSLIALL